MEVSVEIEHTGGNMWTPSVVKARAYRSVFLIGILITAYQLFTLFFLVSSRTLGADTIHSLSDVATIGGTAYLLSRSWLTEHVFLAKRKLWLAFGVWSLGIGGILVGLESLHSLADDTHATLRSWPLLLAAIVGALGNLWMHRILDHATHDHKDALDKNNIDHIFWDMILSIAVLLAYLSGEPLVDRIIAIIVGFLVLPYLAIKRWKEDEHEHEHGHADHHH